MNPELVLVVGDMFVPQRSPDISDQFKSILIPNKLQHVLSLGNIGSRESNDWLKSLSNDFHQVKGDYDGGDQEALSNVQRELGCDILLSAHTHQIEVRAKEGKFFINPGSISGAFSYSMPDPTPSFVLMVLQGEEAIVYLYVLNDKKEKFEVNKLEFSKNAGDFKKAEEEEEGEEEGEEKQDVPQSNEPQSTEQPQEGTPVEG